LLFSIVIPTYNSNPKLLEEAVYSVVNQTYRKWELILSDDASNGEIHEFLQEIQKCDSRINLKLNKHHLGIAGTLNAGISESRGAFVGFLDHDDLLHKDALKMISIVIQKKPSIKFVYTDEDKVDLFHNRFDPYFKPDWNPDLLYSQNYINHFSVFSANLLSLIGGFRVGYDGAQDWDLLLRLEKIIKPNEIFHVPLVLYHWRAVKGSTALADSEKKWTVGAQRAVLNAFIKENKINAKAELLANGFWSVNRKLESNQPMVTIIIPINHNFDKLKAHLENLKAKTSYRNFEMLLVHNQNNFELKGGFFTWLDSEGFKVFEFDQPFSIAELNNQIARFSRSRVLIYLKNDLIVLSKNWLENMVVNAIRPEIGAVGAMIYDPGYKIQHAGLVLGINGVAGHVYQGFYKGFAGQFGRAQLSQNYSAVTGACLAIERNKLLNVGGFDEKNLHSFFSDVDLCIKLQVYGYRNLWLPKVEFIYNESTSKEHQSDPNDLHKHFDEEFAYMKNKWGTDLLMDPAYNPNLTLEQNDASFSEPPRTDWLARLLEN